LASAAPGEDGHAAGVLLGDDVDDAAALGGGEARELAGRAVGIESVHAALDEPGDEAAQFGLVDLAAVVEGDEDGGEDALQFAQFGSNRSGFQAPEEDYSMEPAWGRIEKHRR
jgi:hypothetical protein